MTDDRKTRVISNPIAQDDADRRTRIISQPAEQESQVAPTRHEPADEPRTRVFTGPQDDHEDAPVDQTFEPTVGWLVVVKGPGRGHSRQIHYGMNSLGRGPSERISLNFGDSAISREAHAYIVYDDKQKEFYIQHAGKSNLVRVNDSPVMAPKELTRGDLIELGSTTLMFVPLCGDDFNWDEA